MGSQLRSNMDPKSIVTRLQALQHCKNYDAASQVLLEELLSHSHGKMLIDSIDFYKQIKKGANPDQEDLPRETIEAMLTLGVEVNGPHLVPALCLLALYAAAHPFTVKHRESGAWLMLKKNSPLT